MDISRFAAHSPGCHPVAIGSAAFLCGPGLLQLPHVQVLKPGPELESLGLRQGRICPFLQPLGHPANRGCSGGLLQGLCIPASSRASLFSGLPALAGLGPGSVADAREATRARGLPHCRASEEPGWRT
ncbi:MAG: hypothetical protein ACYDHX_16740 [Methanothrix sp.]